MPAQHWRLPPSHIHTYTHRPHTHTHTHTLTYRLTPPPPPQTHTQVPITLAPRRRAGRQELADTREPRGKGHDRDTSVTCPGCRCGTPVTGAWQQRSRASVRHGRGAVDHSQQSPPRTHTWTQPCGFPPRVGHGRGALDHRNGGTPVAPLSLRGVGYGVWTSGAGADGPAA